MRLVMCLLIVFVVVPSLQARTAKRFYNKTCAMVWKAAVDVASHKPYRMQIENQKTRQMMVQTGSYWATVERSISLRLVDKGEGCEGISEGPYAGLIHHDTKDLLKRIAKRLPKVENIQEPGARETAAPVASSPAADSQKPASEEAKVPAGSAETKLGTVNLTSSPSGADVYVDGDFVGQTPAKLELDPGKHNIRLTDSGYEGWSKQVVVLAASSVALNATLEKQ